MSPLVQAWVAGGLAAVAALWVLWSVLLPRGVKQAIAARFGKAPASGGCERCGR